jgi:hypothetical protein
MHTFVGKKYHIYLDKKAIQELRVKEGPFFSGCQKGFLSKQTQDSDTVICISCSPPAKSWCAVHDVAETHTVFQKSPLQNVGPGLILEHAKFGAHTRPQSVAFRHI